ncbi:MAG: GtrA family protein [Oscillospiraceae bacterium]|nr:GtrA family protein [Oscillospiraceae bacterium]
MKIRSLFYKYKEWILYLFWGFATTAVNYIVYFLCTRLGKFHYIPANILAWLWAVLFAFWSNKSFVFRSQSWQPNVVIPELCKFTGARILSGVLETGILWLCVDRMHLYDGLVKLLAGILVIILNYIFSKCFIFRKGE